MGKIDLHNHDLYLNRELSQIQFVRRVLAQSRRDDVPALERLRFLCISTIVTDEFFEVRVASVKQQQAYGITRRTPDGRTPTETLTEIRRQMKELVREQYRTFNEVLVPLLDAEDIRFVRRSRWTKRQRKWLQNYFRNELLPVLSPLGLDPAHPFPRILNKSLNFAVLLEGTDAFGREGEMALVRAPRSLPRVIRLPASHSDGPDDFVFLSSILHAFVDELFPGMTVNGCFQFRVTRNSELLVDEEETENLARALQEPLLERGYARAVRLEVADNCPEHVLQILTRQFELHQSDTYRCDGPVNLNRLTAAYDLVDKPELKYPPFTPRPCEPMQQARTPFDVIRRQDIVLHHPYDSFAPVVELVKRASQDPAVLAIKQTLYRTGRDSPMVQHLVDAARAGKDVTVVIELRARFDELANIERANRLQEAGVQVVYGVVGYKTHAKMLLIVRREQQQLRRYVHLGTGNYHAGTALSYTDCGLLTCNPEIGQDVHDLFQQLSGLGPQIDLNKLIQAPFQLHRNLLDMIKREAQIAESGKPGRIIARMNAVTEPKVIRALYRASAAGVQIDLIVRGVCCLRPGIKGLSENIRVRSIVGRFLEHTRSYYFSNDGADEFYLSSADWMDRNLLHRVEVCFPVLNTNLRRRLKKETLDNYLKDNLDAWELNSDGTYKPVDRRSARGFSAQRGLLKGLIND